MRSISVLVVLLLLSIVSAACGGDDDDPTATARPATQPPATATAAATATAPAEPVAPTATLQPAATDTPAAEPTATQQPAPTATTAPTPTTSPTSQPTPSQDPVVYHDIIFGDRQEYRGGQYPEGIQGLWAIDADGSDLHQITQPSEGYETWPSVSPDGRYLAFSRSQDGEGGVYILDIESGEEVWVADGRGWAHWSPDSTRLLLDWQERSFGPACCGGGRELDDPVKIAIVAADGSNFWVLAEPTYVLGQGGTIVGGAAWSPDGSSILYAASTYERRTYDDGTPYEATVGTALVVVDSDGDNPLEIDLDGMEFANGFRWSPSGETIVFRGSAGEENPGLFAIAPDGSGLRQLTPPNLAGWEFEFTPDGQGVAFPGNGATNPLFTVNLDGSGLTQITPDDVSVGRFTYSPDGRKIAFPAGETGINVMNADGTGLVTYATSWLYWKAEWSPDGTRLLFLASSESGPTNDLLVLDLRTGMLSPVLSLVRHGEGVIQPAWRPGE